MDNLIQKSLSNIAKTVQQRFGQATKGVSNFIGNNYNTIQQVSNLNPFGPKLPVAPKQAMQNYQNIGNTLNKLPNPVKKFGEGFTEASALGLYDMPMQKSQNNYDRAGYVGGYVAGMVNPLNPANKIFGALNIGQKATTGLLSKVAPQATGFIAKKLLPNIAGEATQTAGYMALKKISEQANLTPKNQGGFGEQLAYGLLGRGAFGVAGRGLGNKLKAVENKIGDDDVKAIGQIFKRSQTNWMEGKAANMKQFEKDLNLVDEILVSKYGATKEELKKIPEIDRVKNLFSMAMEDYRGFQLKKSGLVSNLVDKPPQMMTPVVTGKARLKVRMKPVEGIPEMQAPKMNLEELNKAGGLPPEGLQAQPQQKKSIISSLYDRFLNESRNKLNQMGPAGQQISKKIDNMYTEAQRQAGSKVADLTKVMKGLDNTGSEDLIKGLRGEKGLANDNRVKSVREILNKVYADAKAVRLDIGYRENYAPQMVDLEKLKVNREQAINHFIETNQMKPDNAVGFIDDVLNGTDVKEAYNRFGKALPKKMGNLEFQRVLDWLPDVLRTDKKLLPDYIEQAYSRIAQVKHFGKNNEIGGNLLQNIQKQGYDTKLAQEILDQNLGLTRYDRTMQKASGIIRSVQAAMKLSTGAITNATQSVNTATVGGTRRTLGEIFKYANPAKRAEMSDFALRTGATLNGTMQQIMDQWKGGKTPLEKLIAPFFGNVENFNRIIAANVGRSKAIAEGIVDEQALLKAGQQMVDKTQFQVRPIDLPTTWTTPMGKVATQFKSFGFRQANFVKKEILDKAVKGDIKPLARFVLAGTLINEISNNIKSVINRKDRPEDIKERIIEDIPGLGFYQDFVEALSYGIKASSYDKNAIPNAIFDFVAGPTGGDVRKFLSNAGQASQGNVKPLLKETVKSIPFVGKPFVNENPKIFGGQSKVKIQDIQNKITGKTEAPKQESEQSILDKQKLKDQISELQKQQKAIYNQGGVNVLGQNFGTMSDSEKIKKMNELESQILVLKEQQKVANISIDMPEAPKLTGNTELDKKLTSKYKGQLTTEANDAIKLFEAGKLSAVEANKIISEVKAIQTKLTPVKLKAAPKVKKVAVRKAKTSTAKFKVKAPKLTKIKITKPKKYKMGKLPKLTKIRALAK